jgi:hypothetical protein
MQCIESGDGHLIQPLHDNGLPKTHRFDSFFGYTPDRFDRQATEKFRMQKIAIEKMKIQKV